MACNHSRQHVAVESVASQYILANRSARYLLCRLLDAEELNKCIKIMNVWQCKVVESVVDQTYMFIVVESVVDQPRRAHKSMSTHTLHVTHARQGMYCGVSLCVLFARAPHMRAPS